MSRPDNRLRIEVGDEGVSELIGTVPKGHGLWIVEQFASAWDTLDGPGHVWAELALSNGVSRSMSATDHAARRAHDRAACAQERADHEAAAGA